jgi:hypothetical protein
MPTRSRAASHRLLQRITGIASASQELIEHRTQCHWSDRLMEQMETHRAGFAQALWGDVARDEKRRNRGAECNAQSSYHLYASFPVTQAKVGNDQIRPKVGGGEARQQGGVRFGSDDTTSPAPQQSMHCVKNERIVVDHQNHFAPNRIGYRLMRDGVFDRLWQSSGQRQRDRKPRASAERRSDLESMIEQTT